MLLFEYKTFDEIIKSMLDRVPSDIDKREGSIIYDAIAPAAAELAQVYIDIETVFKETFADTASRKYLMLRAAERGMKPYKATKAVGKGVFNCAVPIGTRFSIDKFNYKVADVISDDEHSYKMECETFGKEANQYMGTLTPMEYVTNLSKAVLTEIVIPGRDEETTEDFRKRYLSSFNNIAFGGNKEDYIQKVRAIEGVGGVKVYRAWQGGGTVKIVITDSELKKPSIELINDVQKKVDPISGEGIGIAPIDHVVTVFGAEERLVNIETEIMYAQGWSFEDAKMYIEEIIDKYLLELNQNWQYVDNITVRVSQIESRLLDFEGIVDILNTKINGKSGNYDVGEGAIVKRGSIVG